MAGEVGMHGDFWGVDEGALHIEASSHYSLVNPCFNDFDIYDSRGNAVFIGANPGNSHILDNVTLSGINIHGVRDENSYAFYFENPKGSATISDITVDDVDVSQVTNANGGNMDSFSGNGFTLTTTGVETSRPIEIAGVLLRLNCMALSRNSRDGVTEIREGDNVTLSVRVENNSATPLPAGDYPVRVAFRFADGSTVYTGKYTDGLKANNGVILTADWTAKAGGHTVTAVLDPSGSLGAMVAGDGSATVEKRFNVQSGTLENLPYEPTSGVDFNVLDLRWRREGVDEPVGKGPINVGDRILFSAAIVNAGQAAWPALAGTHSFMVHVNDGDKRGESDSANNTATFTLPEIPYAGLAMNEYVDEPDNLNRETTSLLFVDGGAAALCDGRWYTIDGIVLDAEPSRPGIYIRNGLKVAVR